MRVIAVSMGDDISFEELLTAYELAIKRGSALVVDAERGTDVSAEQRACFREEEEAREALLAWAERHM